MCFVCHSLLCSASRRITNTVTALRIKLSNEKTIVANRYFYMQEIEYNIAFIHFLQIKKK